MKQVMYGIEIGDVNDFGGWIGYEPLEDEVAKLLNHHIYLFFQNEYHIRQFAQGRKFVINVNDDAFGKVIDRARIIKAIVENGTKLSMNGYEISAPSYARNIVKPLCRTTNFINEDNLYTFADEHYVKMKTDFNYISDLMRLTSISAVDVLLGSISFENKNLAYHYPHCFIIGDSQINVLDANYQIVE